MVDSQELDNVGMPETTQYCAFFLEAASGVSYSLIVERLVELLGRAREALVLDGVNGSVGASSQFISSLSYSLECVLLQSCCLIRFTSSLRHIFFFHNKVYTKGAAHEFTRNDQWTHNSLKRTAIASSSIYDATALLLRSLAGSSRQYNCARAFALSLRPAPSRFRSLLQLKL